KTCGDGWLTPAIDEPGQAQPGLPHNPPARTLPRVNQNDRRSFCLSVYASFACDWPHRLNTGESDDLAVQVREREERAQSPAARRPEQGAASRGEVGRRVRERERGDRKDRGPA